MEDMADVSGDFVKQLCVCLIQQLVEWWQVRRTEAPLIIIIFPLVDKLPVESCHGRGFQDLRFIGGTLQKPFFCISESKTSIWFSHLSPAYSWGDSKLLVKVYSSCRCHFGGVYYAAADLRCNVVINLRIVFFVWN